LTPDENYSHTFSVSTFLTGVVFHLQFAYVSLPPMNVQTFRENPSGICTRIEETAHLSYFPPRFHLENFPGQAERLFKIQ
jgi:hypothetical protein